MYTAKGTIVMIGETQQVTEKFSKRELAIQTNDPNYPQTVLFQFSQDKCEVLNGYKKGQQVEIAFNLRGREWTNKEGEVKYFNTLDAWRIETLGNQQPQAENSPDQKPLTQVAEESDDLPF